MVEKKFKISHKMFGGFAIIIFIMLSVIVYSYFSFIKQDNISQQNLQTHEIISYTESILENMLNMETGVRGYALTGKDEFLEPFYKGELNYAKFYDLVKTHTINNELQQERLIRLDDNQKKWLKYVDYNFIVGRQRVNSGQDNYGDLISRAQEGNGKKYMDIIRSIINEIIDEETAILLNRRIIFEEMKTRTILIMSLGGLIATIISVLITILITGLVVKPVKSLTNTFNHISIGKADYKYRLSIKSKDELGELANNFNTFMDKIETVIIENSNESWIKTGQAELNEKLRAAKNIKELTMNAINYIALYTNAQIGAIYGFTGHNTLKLLGSYAYKKSDNVSNEIKLGEGIVGQSAIDRQTIFLTGVPEDYTSISSGVGQAVPRNIIVTPCIYRDDIKCIIEIGSFNQFTSLQLEFIKRVSEGLAVAIHSVESRIRMEELLETTLKQSEELKMRQNELSESNDYLENQTMELKQSEEILQAQQEELRQSNEELEEQSKALMVSEGQLQTQQEELRVINEELEERTKSLELQKNDITTKNENLRRAQVEIEEKAKAIEITSKYKSEFLANMSHELRTPLNSILVLSQIIGEKEVNSVLTNKHLEYANTIHSSGQDLLELINDILDLSKVEAGKIDIVLEPVNVLELPKYVERSFNHIAEKNGVELKVHIGPDLPETIISDASRLQQILNNLLSNAFKFTHEGEVTFSIHRPKEVDKLIYKDFDDKSICISISDTGIGISKDKQPVIFDAFKQSDGTISRKYGGTGLGLSISKGLANNLGGEIYLQSEEGKGSMFTLVLPEECKTPHVDTKSAVEDITKLVSLDQPNKMFSGIEEMVPKQLKKLMVLYESGGDDQNIIELLGGQGIEVSSLDSGKKAIEAIKKEEYDCIILDLKLKDMTGIQFLESLWLNNITNIPIIIYTDNVLKQEEEIQLKQYAESIIIKGSRSCERLIAEVNLFLHDVDNSNINTNIKPIKSVQEKEDSLKDKKVLIVDDDMRNVFALSSLLEEKGIKVIVGRNGKEGIQKLNENTDADLILMDIMMPIMDGYQAMKEIRSELRFSTIPIIALTAKAMKDDRQKSIDAGANDYLTKPIDLERLISLLRVWLYK